MAGVPFDDLEKLGTLETSEAARKIFVKQRELVDAASATEDFIQSHVSELSTGAVRAWKKAIRWGGSYPSAPEGGFFQKLRQSASELADAMVRLDECLHRELEPTRTLLLQSAKKVLPSYLVFTAPALRERVSKQLASNDARPRNKQARSQERHLLLYAQRLAAKNDSLSEFGPCGWGRIDDGQTGIAFAPEPGIAARETFLERWTAHAAAAVLNADPEVRQELSPRIHPNGSITGNQFIFGAAGESISVDTSILELLLRCDGNTPAHSLGVDLSTLEQLAEQNIIRWEIEVPALDPYAFDSLVADISRWRNSSVRTRWLDKLQPIAALPRRFGAEPDIAERARIMDDAGARLEQLGANRKGSTRFLYAATNPIGEECFRECAFSIAPGLINEVATDAAPWIDLWRDNYAFVASRVAAGLRGLFEKAGPREGAVSLPAFLQFCETANMSLTGPGLVALVAIAFEEVKTAFRARLEPFLNETEHELTTDECHFIRQQFEYDKFDEYTYPSADIQLAAKSIDAVAAGEYQWILAELHPPVALLHHGFYWACPAKAALGKALASTTFGQPNFHCGFFAADFTATTSVHLFDMPDNVTKFVASQRGNPEWPTFRPAETEVYVDQSTGDVCLRKIDNREYLGSFARNWIIPLGFHPFYFSLGESSPRLRCGKVVVQRRGWTVRQEELGPGNFTGVSRDLVLAVERLRAEKDLPRYVYIRPSERVLRRSGAEGRDKDTKPVFVDLESYLFLEIFHRWLTKAGEIEITEMLPAPDDLLWREADGRRTFELRTQIIPGK